MRKRTGKKTAIFLAAALAFQTGFSASPAWAGDGMASSGVPVSGGSAINREETALTSAMALRLAPDVVGNIAGGTGQVDVSVTAALLLHRATEFTVTLTGAQGFATKLLCLDAASVQTEKVSFEGIAPGNYELTLTAQGFAKFAQNITVGEQGCAVSLTTGFLGGVAYAEGNAHPGVLLIGDVDGDGTVGEADRKALVDAVDQNTNAAGAAGSVAGGVMDLNGDGVVDLVDLEYFTKGYGQTLDTAASPEVFVPASVIVAKAGDNTNVKSGEIADVLKGNSSVSLEPRFGGEISAGNPVTLEFDFVENPVSGSQAVVADGILIETAGNSVIKDAAIRVEYQDENGADGFTEIPVNYGISYLLNNSQVRTERDASGNIRIYLGSQIAVKKVTLTITGMMNNSNLAEISKVEFANGMEERIPEPQMDIPQNLRAVAGSEQIALSWNPCVNVTGYEVLVEQGDLKETMLVTGNSLTLTSFGGKNLKNYTEYKVSVQSVNGTWRSGYCGAVSATPKPTKRPDKPDNVSAVGNYQSITVSWKQMKDTLTYNLYYKQSASGSYQVIRGLTDSNYTITNLRDLTEYTVYVTGVNEFGESAPSLTASAKTTDLQAPVVPRYHLINTGSAGEKPAHIISVARRAACTVANSPLDQGQTASAWATVDNNPASYYQTAGWDEGGFNPMGADVGLIYEFDQAYKMDTVALYGYSGYDFTYTHVRWWGADNVAHDLSGVSVQTRQDAEGRSYRLMKFAQPVEAKKIQIGFGRYLADGGTMRVAEIYFYHYDSLMEEIMSLYEDDLHMVLRADVTQATIDALRARINEIDEVSGEYNPDREVLERELATAEDILNDVALKAPIQVHADITMNDAGRGFGGLNAWQPLGVTAGAGDRITIYVGHPNKKTGDATDLRLVATQYHSEANAVATSVTTLKAGANVVVIPRIGTLAGQENGGALYIEYTGNNSEDRYAVRVSGGVAVPRLDLHRVTNAGERLERVTAYVSEMEAYVAAMAQNHERFHKTAESSLLNEHEYDVTNCILGASDILLDKMMFSLPAPQIISGDGTVQEKATRILASLDAMEDMMYLFYQHKGLNADAADAVDQIPKAHLNIRYQRMFSGAFMYAAGNHIGIEWGSAPGMMSAVPVASDADGRYQSGRYFGWGIAHEIGHNINQGAYTVAEITNNYFAVLAQAKDTNDSVRFSYNNVFEKVTSGTKGRASNVFTQLAMYWQLHLAYDKGYNYKTYADYNEQLANLFFARVDTYARTPAKAPQAATNGVALTLSGGTDQVLMRLSCAAAEKNLLEFFERWGMTPDEGTIAYAKQFPEETRAIYYANDDARVYALTNAGSSLNADKTVVAVSDSTTAVINPNAKNQVDFTLAAQAIPADDVLGFEITRCMVSGGKTQKETVGFVTGGTFTDTVSTINNRMVWYEVAVIDKYLNRSATKVLEPMKIEHDGSLDKSFFTVTTKDLTVAGETEETTGSTSDVIYDTDQENDVETTKSREKLIDHDIATVYEAGVGANAEIILEFNKTAAVTGFKYTAGSSLPTGSYEISLLLGDAWTTVAEGSFGTATEQTIYFANEENQYVGTFEASAAKLLLKGMAGSTVSIAELDVLGVTGDNVDFRRAEEGTAAIGRLAEDYKYGEGENDLIPKGSIVFTGSYKGNPAYNVVILYDQNGNMVGASAAGDTNHVQQIILADVPNTGNIQDTSNGTWIYWVEPDTQAALEGVTKVRAELYRVNNALTNEGQRLVSDSLFEAMPALTELPEITIQGR